MLLVRPQTETTVTAPQPSSAAGVDVPELSVGQTREARAKSNIRLQRKEHCLGTIACFVIEFEGDRKPYVPYRPKLEAALACSS